MATDASQSAAVAADGRRSLPTASAPWRLGSARVLLTVWLAGTLAAAAALLLSLVRVRRLARARRRRGRPGVVGAADALGGAPRTAAPGAPARESRASARRWPAASGVPSSSCPSSARDWSAERRDVVLAHEIAHLAGRDPLRHVAARLAVALYWFHPLAWMAARQATVAREQACDEAVLALGTRPSAYARVLLELAESMQPSAAGARRPADG